jgi:hypothetical protein
MPTQAPERQPTPAVAESNPSLAGTDAERRAAVRLSRELSSSRRRAELETFWCRPNWPAALAWHLALAIAGSLVSVDHAKLGGAMILVALLSQLADWTFGISPGRLLTLQRASQNVVSAAPARGRTKGSSASGTSASTTSDSRVTLLVVTSYDSARGGLATRGRLRRVATNLQISAGGLAPGWMGWLAILMLWMLATALLRVQGSHGAVVSAAQLVPTVVLVLALALALELATGLGDDQRLSATTAALALTRALDAAPPANLAVQVVLSSDAGSGEGLRAYLRRHRAERKRTNTVVLGLLGTSSPEPAHSPDPAWLISDGALVPLRFFGRLQELAAKVASASPELGLHPVRQRGCSPALRARIRRLPALTLAGGEDRELMQAALLLIDEIDAYVGELPPS